MPKLRLLPSDLAVQGRYTPEFRDEMRDLLRWRCDVRRFRTDPVEAALLDRCLTAYGLAPLAGCDQRADRLSMEVR